MGVQSNSEITSVPPSDLNEHLGAVLPSLQGIVQQTPTVSFSTVQSGDLEFKAEGDPYPVDDIEHRVKHTYGDTAPDQGYDEPFDVKDKHLDKQHFDQAGISYTSEGSERSYHYNHSTGGDGEGCTYEVDGKTDTTRSYHIEQGKVSLDDKGNHLTDVNRSWFSKGLSFIAPLFIAFGWVNFFESTIKLAKAKDKSFSLWSECILSFLTAAGSTLIFALVLAAIPGIIYAAPYVLGVIVGLNILRGLFRLCKSVVACGEASDKADQTKDLDEKIQYKKEAGNHAKTAWLHFLGIICNILSLVAIVYVFKAFEIKTHPNVDASFLSGMDPSTTVNAGQFGNTAAQYLQSNIVDSANAFSNTAFNLFISIFTLAIPGLLMKACRTNKESLAVFYGEKKMTDTFEGQAIQRMKSVLDCQDENTHPGVRIAKLLVSPVVIACYGVTAIAHFLFRPLSIIVLGLPQMLCHYAKRSLDKKYIDNLAGEVSEITAKLKRIERRIVKYSNRPDYLPKYQGQKKLFTGIETLLNKAAEELKGNQVNSSAQIKSINATCYHAIEELEAETLRTHRATYHKDYTNRESNSRTLVNKVKLLLETRQCFFAANPYARSPATEVTRMKAVRMPILGQVPS